MRHQRAILVVGLGFGDCGKGSIVDYLVRATGAGAVVRYNGGPQAAHNVVTVDGRHHTFAQFGSGTLAGGSTVLSRFMSIDPYAMTNEANHLQQLGVADVWERLTIDRRCMLVTPVHQAANHLRERARGVAAHGTCGMGVGEAVADSIQYPHLILRASELGDASAVARKLRESSEIKQREFGAIFDPANADAALLNDTSWIDVAIAQYADIANAVRIASAREIASRLNAADTIVFEGAQGVLLDQHFGFHPHTTWSTTTTGNAMTLLDEAGFSGSRYTLGVLRPYMTRHGNGPLVSEDAAFGQMLCEPHNGDDGWAGAFRFGRFDAVAARYAIATNGGINGLALTCLDHVKNIPPELCNTYELDGDQISQLPLPASLKEQQQLTQLLARCRPVIETLAADSIEDWARAIEGTLQVRVQLKSTGPTARDKITGDDLIGY